MLKVFADEVDQLVSLQFDIYRESLNLLMKLRSLQYDAERARPLRLVDRPQESEVRVLSLEG